MATTRAQTIQLAVPYFSQRDSATSQGERMCFSSSCAMAAFLKPGSLTSKGQVGLLLRLEGGARGFPHHAAPGPWPAQGH